MANKQVRAAFAELQKAFDKQFRVDLLEQEPTPREAGVINVWDHGPGSGVQFPGSLRARWVKKNGSKFGFQFTGEVAGRLEWVGAPPEHDDDEQQPETDEIKQVEEVTEPEEAPTPSPMVFSRKHRREEGTNDADE